MSFIASEMGIDLARWVLGQVGTLGHIKVMTNIASHNGHVEKPGDMTYEEFDNLMKEEEMVLGRTGYQVTVNDCLEFLEKLEKYANLEMFDTGRSYFFEGIYEVARPESKSHFETAEKVFEFSWGS